MKLRALTFRDAKPDDDQSQGGAVPEMLLVDMTLAEAMFVATVLGKIDHVRANAILPGGAEASSGVYACLNNDVFNRYWDDGLNDARRTI